MVHNSKFHGLPMEDPLEHLDQFDRVCDLTKINGVSEDSFKLRLFPFSLGDKAHQWEKNLPRGTIQTWEQCKLAFLSKGALPKIRNQLDTSSNGKFLGKEINAALELVENLAMSNDTYGEDFDRANRTEGSSKELRMEKDIRELQNKLDKVLVATQKPIPFLGEFDEQGPSFENVNEDGLTEEEINYIGNQNRYQRFNNFNSNQNFSYRNPNVANLQDQVYLNTQGQQSYVPKGNFQGNFVPKQQFARQQ
ncbi:uncharacterized protein LOC112089110 [Eutrema salsugineum]|uniref:uncharacterized protein LOC112089110 n=1 Tax=Eutrema salsugineum TaxID=72664 RepID=UPI000CED3749|nr:uncharacterized protein LOC112089110 [Eutrema salsugineum]